MPNWCENNVMIYHEEQNKVNAIAEVCESEDKGLFEFIKPEPSWIDIPNDDGDYPMERDIEDDNGEVIIRKREFPDGTVDERWYDWRCSSWGTKWDVGEYLDHEFIVNKQGSKYCLELSFWTAWSPPIGIYETLVEKGFGVSADYIEGGMGYVGTWIDGVDSEYRFDDQDMPKKLKRLVKFYRGD